MKFVSLLLATLIATTGISGSGTNNVQVENSIDKEKAAELVSLSENVKKVDKETTSLLLQKSQTTKSVLGDEFVDNDNAEAYSYDENGKTVYLLKRSISKDGFNILSNVTTVFDEGQNVVMNQESHFTNNQGKFEMTLYIDGKESYSEKTDIDYLSNDQVQNVLMEWKQMTSSRGLNLACFASISGAGAGVSGLILKLCGAPCAFIPPVCIGCLIGIIAVGGGSIVGAVMNCWD